MLAEPLPPAFARRVVELAPGEDLPYRVEDWRDALVLVRDGEVQLEGRCGSRRVFRAGDLLFLTGLGIHALHNCGPVATVLVAISRRTRHA